MAPGGQQGVMGQDQAQGDAVQVLGNIACQRSDQEEGSSPGARHAACPAGHGQGWGGPGAPGQEGV